MDSLQCQCLERRRRGGGVPAGVVGRLSSCRWHLGIAILRSYVTAWQCQGLPGGVEVGVGREGSCKCRGGSSWVGTGRKPPSAFTDIFWAFPKSRLAARFRVMPTPCPQTHTQADKAGHRMLILGKEERYLERLWGGVSLLVHYSFSLKHGLRDQVQETEFQVWEA